MTTLASLDGKDLGGSPAARRRALARLSDGEIAERLVPMAKALQAAREVHAPLAVAASLPLAEVLASPFALRAVAMGVEVGATTRHVELRRRPEWPEALVGAEEVRDPDHGVWDRGALKSGKYQGFMADEPFATYDPTHVSKWGPHELMHRAAGFLWRRGLTRWELYLGARLNELVPVVLFYGPEQVMRLDEGSFDWRAAGMRPAARLEDARWLGETDAELLARAARGAPVLRHALDHFENELAAIDQELATGRRVRVPHPVLDASSDATAYVVGHHSRLSDSAVGSVLSCVPRAVRSEDPLEYRNRIECLFDRLLFEPLQVDLETAAQRRCARVVWDLLLRSAHLGEGVEADLLPLLDDAAAVLAGHAPVEIDRWCERLRDALGEEDAASVLADGSLEQIAAHLSDRREESGRTRGDAGAGVLWDRVDLEQLADGVGQVAPCAWTLLDDEEALRRFAASAALWQRAPLADRVVSFLESEGTTPGAVLAMARFERAIVSAQRDDGIERLAVPEEELPEDLAGGVVVRSEGFERLDLDYDVLSVHAGHAAGEPLVTPDRKPTTLLVGAHFDGVSVLPLPPAVSAAWDALELAARPAHELIAAIDRALEDREGPWPSNGEAWLRELIAAGAVGWHPR